MALAMGLRLALVASAFAGAAAEACAAAQGHTFPAPRVAAAKRPLTKEQRFMAEQWPGYHNGVSLGGGFVVEDWMFWRDAGENVVPETLHLQKDQQFDNHAWSQALLKGDKETAFATMDCHLSKFYSDEDFDQFAEFGINSVRLPVGYWLFDDPALYPDDKWVVEPHNATAYGVNPDGFITPGTIAVTDVVMKLWNRNMRVLLDMHALPGCSSPRQSYAGIHCQSVAPNTWNGEAHAGISGGTTVQRADDGKTWMDVARKIALERVVPWIKFMEKHAPGAIIGYELVNEPDIASSDATKAEVKALSLDLGKEAMACLGADLADQVKIGISTAGKSYESDAVAADYQSSAFAGLKSHYISDIHHYFYWAGCIDYGTKTFSIQCACEANLPGTAQAGEDLDWARWMKSGVFDEGWRFYVGEWSAALGTAHKCHYGVPTHRQAGALWQAQKWGYLSQYVHYKGMAGQGKSSFLGDFYWNGRMGYNWNPDPKVCAGRSSDKHYKDFKSWDWSLLRLIKLGLAKPLSELGFYPTSLAGNKSSTCTGTLRVLCSGPVAPAAPAGGQPGMADTAAAPPGGQPGMSGGNSGKCAKAGQSCAVNACCDQSLVCKQVNQWYKGCVTPVDMMKKNEELDSPVRSPTVAGRTTAMAFAALGLAAVTGAAVFLRRRRTAYRGYSVATFEALTSNTEWEA